VRAVLPCVLMSLVMIVCAQATDCSVSKEFQLGHRQVLAGVLQDPVGAALSGIELELLSGKKAVRHLRTNNEGRYDFGELPSGKYKIHVRSSGNAFCAPKVQCRAERCSFELRLTLNPKNMVRVD
jgi:hypothetical protein